MNNLIYQRIPMVKHYEQTCCVWNKKNVRVEALCDVWKTIRFDKSAQWRWILHLFIDVPKELGDKLDYKVELKNFKKIFCCALIIC